MTAPCPTDPATDIVDAFISALKAMFNPDRRCKPDGGGSHDVRFFAAAQELLPMVGEMCRGPFLWVRVASRFRAKPASFPTAFVGKLDCSANDTMRVLGVEIGVARCTSIEADTNWATLAREAEISLDDSWRIEQALCTAAKTLREQSRAVATDTIAPTQIEGGLIAWTGMAYIEI